TQDPDADRVIGIGRVEYLRRVASEIRGRGITREGHDPRGLVAELLEHVRRQAGAGPHAVADQQAFLQQRLTEAGAAALVGDGEAPAAEGTKLTAAPAQIGRAGADDGDRAVVVAESAL